MLGLDSETQDGKAILLCVSIPEPIPDSISSFWLLDSMRCPIIKSYGKKAISETSLHYFRQIMEWLFRFEQDFVCYNLTFDAQAIFGWLTKRQQWELARLGTCEIDPFRLKWIPGKELEVRWKKKKFRMFDCAQFYHMKLETASQKFLGKGKLELPGKVDITKMYEALTGPYRDTVIEYCHVDAQRAQELWELVESGLLKVNAEVVRPISPAYIAGRFFLRKQKKPSRQINGLFKRCYRGGRIEMFRRGYHEDLYCYDIHSAYPSIIVDLPDMRDLTLVIDKEPHPDALLGVYYVKITVPVNNHIGPVPIKGDILTYPVGTWWAWVDLYTLRMLKSYDYLDEVKESVEFHLAVHLSKPRLPFEQIRELYGMRALGDGELDRAIKWLLNGLYGKFAQHDKKYHIVDDILEADLIEMGEYLSLIEKDGWHANYAYASHITGGVRAQLFKAMEISPYSVLMVATDSVWSSHKLPLDIGDKLGQWELTGADKWWGIVSGVYAYKAGGEMTNKFRGFSTATDLPEMLLQAGEKEEIDVTCKLPLSMLWALRNDRPINEIGTWPRTLALNSDKKRYWPDRVNARRLYTRSFESQPLILERDNTHGS